MDPAVGTYSWENYISVGTPCNFTAFPKDGLSMSRFQTSCWVLFMGSTQEEVFLFHTIAFSTCRWCWHCLEAYVRTGNLRLSKCCWILIPFIPDNWSCSLELMRAGVLVGHRFPILAHELQRITQKRVQSIQDIKATGQPLSLLCCLFLMS